MIRSIRNFLFVQPEHPSRKPKYIKYRRRNRRTAERCRHTTIFTRARIEDTKSMYYSSMKTLHQVDIAKNGRDVTKNNYLLPPATPLSPPATPSPPSPPPPPPVPVPVPLAPSYASSLLQLCAAGRSARARHRLPQLGQRCNQSTIIGPVGKERRRVGVGEVYLEGRRAPLPYRR